MVDSAVSEPGPWPVAIAGPLGAVEELVISSDDEEGQLCALHWYPARGWFATSNYCTAGADCPWRDGQRSYPLDRATAEHLAAAVSAALAASAPDDGQDPLMEDILGEDWEPNETGVDDDPFANATSSSFRIECADGGVPLPFGLAEALTAAAEAVRDRFAAAELDGSEVEVSWLEVDGSGWMLRCEPHGVVERKALPRGGGSGEPALLDPQRRRALGELLAQLPEPVRDDAGAARWSARLGTGGQPEHGRLIQLMAGRRRYHAAAGDASAVADRLRALVALLG